MTPSDFRNSDEFREVEALYGRLWGVGTEAPFDVVELHGVKEDAWLTGTAAGASVLDAHRRTLQCLSARGTRSDAARGVRLFRSSGGLRREATLRESASGGEVLEVRWDDAPSELAQWTVCGRVEQLEWSPDEQTLAIQVAGERADLAGIAGGHTPRTLLPGPGWLPRVEDVGDAVEAGRRVWVWSRGQASPRPLTNQSLQAWEIAWCGPGALLVVASDLPGEDRWYTARLVRFSLDGTPTLLRVPDDQIGTPCANPDGTRVAWIEAVCSDRGLVCGTAWLAVGGAEPQPLDIQDIEATHLHWRDDRRLLVSGLRSLETVVVELDVSSGTRLLLWKDEARTLGGWLPRALPYGSDDAVAVVEGYDEPPFVARLSGGRVHTLATLAGGQAPGHGRLQRLAWSAPDGQEIHGWLIVPDERHVRPANGWPLLVDVHGGPINAHRSRWAAHLRSAPLLAARGWAVLLPNPRGSSGRGQAFARSVVGDMGGADALDLVAGVDHLVALGLVDRSRVAITGCSYGGFMSCWLPTRSDRFAAAVAISPVSDWRSQHFGSHIPWFDRRFLRSEPEDTGGPYHLRSAVNFATGCRAPTLLMAGLMDRSTPPEQALYYHRALQMAGKKSVLLSYPEEGHSLRGPRGYIDSAARIIRWLELHAGVR